MKKIASPYEFRAELQQILAYSQTHQPSREVIASELRSLADRVAADRVAASDDPATQIQELKDMLRKARRLRLPDAVAEILRQIKKSEEALDRERERRPAK